MVEKGAQENDVVSPQTISEFQHLPYMRLYSLKMALQTNPPRSYVLFP